jgi:hypothetical protein
MKTIQLLLFWHRTTDHACGIGRQIQLVSITIRANALLENTLIPKSFALTILVAPQSVVSPKCAQTISPTVSAHGSPNQDWSIAWALGVTSLLAATLLHVVLTSIILLAVLEQILHQSLQLCVPVANALLMYVVYRRIVQVALHVPLVSSSKPQVLFA